MLGISSYGWWARTDGRIKMQEPEAKVKGANEAEEITLFLAESASQENTIVLKYGPDLLRDLDTLFNNKLSYDIILVDASSSGFLFSAEEMIEASTLARDLLTVQGALVFVKQDKAVAFVKESPVGFLSFHTFDSFSAVYDYSSTIAKHIQQAMRQNSELRRDSSNLSEQILLTIIPVLTTFGIKLKASVEGSPRRNLVLAAIDNYTPLNSITQHLAQNMSFNEILDEFKQLEQSGAIYPIFPKIPFLVQQFRAGKQFKLKDYLLEARMLSREQLEDAISAMQSKGSQRLSLGALCVAKGFLSARQLEIALQDQAFFGQTREGERTKVRIGPDAESQVQSLIGNLRSTDAAGVVQNLSSNRSTGVVVVEHKDLTFKATFEQGKLTHARQNKLKGNAAVIEFVSVWKEGVFVFIERTPPPDLIVEDCQVTRPIDKLLLDSALSSDNIEAVLKRLPSGAKTVLEKVPDNRGLLRSRLTDPQEAYELSDQEMEQMQRVWSLTDGLGDIQELIKRCQNLTTAQVTAAIARLLTYELLRIQKGDLSQPLARFRSIISLVTEKIGVNKSEALLRISLRESQGYSAVARVFSLSTGCEVGVDLAAAKASSLSLSNVVKALEDWQVKYIEHVSQEMDKTTLRDLVMQIYGRK